MARHKLRQILADGFSCRTQIASLSDRRALRPAQVIQIALRDARLAARAYPEAGRYGPRPTRLGARDKAVLGAAGAALVGGLAWWAVRRASRRHGG